MNTIIENSILVELPITATSVAAGQQFYFNDVPMLRNKKVYGIIAHISGVDYTTSTQGNDIIDGTQAKVSLLTLSTNDSNYPVYQIPVYDLNPVNNGGFIRMFSNIPIDITKCYVQITATASLATNDTWAFTFLYR